MGKLGSHPPNCTLHSPDLSRRILTLSESFDWTVDDKKKIESVTIRITWWFQSIRPVRTLTFWQQSSLRKQMVVYLSYYIWSFLRVCEYSVFNLRLIVMITRSQNYWPVSVSFARGLITDQPRRRCRLFAKWFPAHIEPLHSGRAFWCRFIGAFLPRSRRVLPILTLNIAKGTTDPRVEFISQLQTQILIKFHLQNLDQASTSKS